MQLVSEFQEQKQQKKKKQTTKMRATATTTTTAATAAATVAAARSQQRRHKVREFNELVVCFICHGYMIDPTTVDYCYHAYCRSCILKHLLRDVYCPQCKSSGGAKQINEANLKADNILRAFIYKLVPGLYQRECQRLAQFEAQHRELCDPEEPLQEFFSPAEPISLSLEYHPMLLMNSTDGEVPVRYLQCPASVKIYHLKRFLCSKFDIDPENKQIEIEVIYEDEVLPNEFSLMDVGYCYNWKRHAPMAFRYRILLYDSQTEIDHHNNPTKVNQHMAALSHLVATTDSKSKGTGVSGAAGSSSNEITTANIKREKQTTSTTTSPTLTMQMKSVTFADDVISVPQTQRNRKTAQSTKSSKKSAAEERKITAKSTLIMPTTTEIVAATPSHDFKSLRSNDLRYGDYTALSTSAPTKSSNGGSGGKPTKCDIVVSIPQSQLGNAALGDDDVGFELKTANKKSTANAKNLPKLKIELNSLKAKLTLPKPKSADARLELEPLAKKYCYEEPVHVNNNEPLDLETYAKNIGLKPIETTTATAVAVEKTKCSPSASPMSSCSSSTSGISTNELNNSTGSTSSHKKRKKKHSKDPNAKRKKLHAEISSQTDGKMKVKITAAHNHKTHKLELKRSQSLGSSSNSSHCRVSPNTLGLESVVLNKLKLDETNQAAPMEDNIKSKHKQVTSPPPPLTDLDIKVESSKCNNVGVPASQSNAISDAHASRPLPPSLFKTSQLAFTAMPSALSSTITTTPTTPPTPAKLKPSSLHAARTAPAAQKPLGMSRVTPNNAQILPQFVVPHPPRALSNVRYLSTSTPTSIASAANKHAGQQLKRSLSLDESHKQADAKHMPSSELLHASKYQTKLPNVNRAAAHAYYTPNSMRLFGPDMGSSSSSATQSRIAANVSLATTPISSGGLTIMARPRPITMQMHNLGFTYTPTAATTTTTTAAAATANNNNNNSSSSSSSSSSGGKSSLEIVCITPGAEKKRLMGPPPPSVRTNKSKKLQIDTIPATIMKSPPLSPVVSGSTIPNKTSLSPAYRISPPALINLRNTVPLAAAAASPSSTTCVNKDVHTIKSCYAPPTNGTNNNSSSSSKSKSSTTGSGSGSGTDKTSLRDFRPLTCKDAAAGSADSILDLSANAPNLETTKSTKTATTAAAALKSIKSAVTSNMVTSSVFGNSLEAALNKIKQNISANASSSSASGNGNGTTSSSTDDLQNLHLLSESATAREKISIKPATGSIYDTTKPKPMSIQNSMMRQQNASVRNIPNPSALAFRNQHLVTTTATTTKVTTPTTPTTPTTTVSTAVARTVTQKLNLTNEKIADDTVENGNKTNSVATNNNNNNINSNNNNNNNNNSTSPRALKKLTTIDQVAANLNIRAAAAEAKAAAAEESALVTSSSSTTSATAAAIEESTKCQTDNTTTATNTEKTTTTNEAVATTKTKSDETATATATAQSAAATTTTATLTNFKELSSCTSTHSSGSSSGGSAENLTKPESIAATATTTATVASSA